MQDHELIPGVALGALGASERLVIGAMRLVAAGRGACPAMSRAFTDRLGSQGEAGARGVMTVAHRLPAESQRKLTLGWLCVRGLTWDEAAILGLLEAAQRADTAMIARWFGRLGVDRPSAALQRGVAWTAAAFTVAGLGFDPAVANLTRAETSPMIRIRDQIETQVGRLD